MLQITPQMRILVAGEAVDFRKGIDALAEVCRAQLNADPFSGSVFVFRSRRATSLKIVVYDGPGLWRATQRLSKGRFRWWPQSEESAKVWRVHPAPVRWAAGNPETDAPPVWRKGSGFLLLLTFRNSFLQTRAVIYRGRKVGGEEIAFLRQLILERPQSSRWKLSRELCEAWQWQQANGAPCAICCAGGYC